jgi:uncharacterized protein (TIGR03083 family)
MASANVWPTIHAERKALAAELEGLSDAQWNTPSLCDGWTTRDVLAHMTATAKITAGSFFPKLLTSGFSFEKVQSKGIAEELGSNGADTLTRFKAAQDRTSHPPGPVDTLLGETLIHGEDIRRPLGLAHAYPMSALVESANFFKGSNLIIGTKKRIAGLSLKATDTDWSIGSGPEVSGPMLSLLMAMTGRKAVLADLSGEGVATLKSRP